MLIACTSCHRQYDVGDLAPGSKVRCACTRLNEVPRVRSKRVAVSHCGNCGAARGEKGLCEYCGAPPAPAAPRGPACPECFAQLPPGARFCHGCGTGLRPESIVRAVTRSTCPRCEGQLILAEGADDPFHQCTACGGIWLSLKAFQRFIDASAGKAVLPEAQRSVSLLVRARPAGRRRRTARVRPKVRALDCPVCGAPMLVTHYARYSGIEVDSCRSHGWWFDGDELQRIGTFVAGGGLEEVERRRAHARRVKRTALSWRRRVAQERRGRASLLELLLDLASGD